MGWCRVWGSACAVRQSSRTRSKPLLGSKRNGEGEHVCVHVGGCVGNGDSQWFCMRTDACSELTVRWPWDAQKSLEAFPPEEITQPNKGTVCFLYIFYRIQTDEQVRCAQSSAAASASLIHKKWYRACITLLAAFSFSCLSSFILLVSILNVVLHFANTFLACSVHFSWPQNQYFRLKYLHWSNASYISSWWLLNNWGCSSLHSKCELFQILQDHLYARLQAELSAEYVW